jgi:Tfp pilus assembly protein PilO
VRKSRRQIVMRIVEAAGLGLVVLDVVLYFAVYRPLGNMVASEEQRYTHERQGARQEQVRVERLKKYQAALPEADKRLEDFTTNHTPPHRRRFSVAARLIREVADASGVQPASVAYRLDTKHNDPLERLGLEINVTGSYTGLLKFAHALETARDLILVREFSFTPADNGVLNLRLVADLYSTP